MKNIKFISLILAVLMLLPLALAGCRGNGDIPGESSSESESGTGQDVIPTKTKFVVKEYFKRGYSYTGTIHRDEMENSLEVWPNKDKDNPYMGELNILGYTVYPKEWKYEIEYYDRSKTLDVYYGITARNFFESIYADSQTHEVLAFFLDGVTSKRVVSNRNSPDKTEKELEEQAWEWFKAQTDDYASYELVTTVAKEYYETTTFTFTRWIGGLETIDQAYISITSKGNVVNFYKVFLGIAQNLSLDYNIDLDAVKIAVEKKANSIYGYLMKNYPDSVLELDAYGSPFYMLSETRCDYNKVLSVLDGRLVLLYTVKFYYTPEAVPNGGEKTELYVFVD